MFSFGNKVGAMVTFTVMFLLFIICAAQGWGGSYRNQQLMRQRIELKHTEQQIQDCFQKVDRISKQLGE